MEEDWIDFNFPSVPESEPSSPQRSDHDMPDLEWCLQREHDVALVYAEEDDEDALTIMKEMIEGTGLDVRLQTDEECFGANIVERPAKIASKCWLVLVVHTPHTTKDTIARFTKNELIACICLEQCKDYIRPLKTERNLPALPGLTSIDSLFWDSQSKGTIANKKIKEIIEYQKQEDRTRRVENLKLEAPVIYSDVKFKRQFSGDQVTFGAELGLVFSFLNSEKELVYKMEGSPKGLMVIINNYDFKDAPKYANRDSSNKDAKLLEHLFHEFGFEVETETNLTAQGIKDKFEQHVKTFDYCCFAAAILSHGKNGRVLGIDGNAVSLKKIKNIFIKDGSKHLTEKPKLFFIQACQQGETLTELPTVTHSPSSRESDFYWAFATVPGETLNELPTVTHSPSSRESDFYWALATVPGYPAWRDEDGSYFITSLVDVFRKYAHKYDLAQLMAKVAYDVKRRTSSFYIETSGNEARHSPQVPERTTTLTKQLYFFPGI